MSFNKTTLGMSLAKAMQPVAKKVNVNYYEMDRQLPHLREAIENQDLYKVRLYLADMMARLQQNEIFEYELQAQRDLAEVIRESL